VPTEVELDLACTFLVIKSALLFFEGAYGIPETLPLGGSAQIFVKKWRQVPLERREAAYIEVQRRIWQGLLDHLEGQGPRPGEKPYQHLIRREAVWNG
jgi:hypothetical protein